MVEHRTFNAVVGGSIPPRLTTLTQISSGGSPRSAGVGAECEAFVFLRHLFEHLARLGIFQVLRERTIFSGAFAPMLQVIQKMRLSLVHAAY